MKSKLWKIIRMEFRLTVANKAFIVLTILGPFLIAAVTVLPSVFSMKGGIGGSAELKVAVVNAGPEYIERLRMPLAQNGIRVFAAQGNTESLDAEVLAGSFDSYLVLPDDLLSATRVQYVSKNVADFRLMASCRASSASPSSLPGCSRPGCPPRRSLRSRSRRSSRSDSLPSPARNRTGTSSPSS